MSTFDNCWVFSFLVTVFLATSLSIEGTVAFRHKQPSSCSKWHRRQINHTMCLEDNPNVQGLNVKDYEKEKIVNLHNKLRSKVDPPASDMVKMVWDDKLAEVAQKWAMQCSPNNDMNRRIKDYHVEIGQNVASGKNQYYWKDAIMSWFKEKDGYVYGLVPSKYPQPDGAKAVRHYVQMVAAQTSRIGCGFAMCSYIGYFVCNYAPSTSKIATPYTASVGGPCTLCRDKCNNGLCDCGGKLCMHKKKLNVNNCKCQ